MKIDIQISCEVDPLGNTQMIEVDVSDSTGFPTSLTTLLGIIEQAKMQIMYDALEESEYE